MGFLPVKSAKYLIRLMDLFSSGWQNNADFVFYRNPGTCKKRLGLPSLLKQVRFGTVADTLTG
jgi:hypothetical protein